MQIQDLVDFIQDSIIKAKTPVIAADSKLFEDGLIDSVSVLSLVGYVEKTLDRRLEDSELLFEHFSTPSEIVSYYGKTR